MSKQDVGAVSNGSSIEPASVVLSGVKEALRRHKEESKAECKRQEKSRKLVARLVYGLGIPAGTLAVAAGSSALASAPTAVTAAIAFLSAAFTTATAVVAPVEGRMDHGRKAADYADFCRRVDLALMRAERLTADEQLLEALNEARHRLDARNPVRRTGQSQEPT